jgi:hypothetical protein
VLLEVDMVDGGVREVGVSNDHNLHQRNAPSRSERWRWGTSPPKY